jgi:hypothetical protein
MQIGNAWLKIDSTGSNIFLEEITPAEAALLNADHEANAKGPAVQELVLVGDVERTGEAEINRLKEKYPNSKNKKGEQWATVLYPGKNPVLPQKFSEVGIESIEGPKKVPAATAAPMIESVKADKK